MLKVGTHIVSVIIPSLELLVGVEGLEDVQSQSSVELIVKYYLASEDSYHLTLLQIRPKCPTYMRNSKGLHMSVYPSQELFHILTSVQLQEIEQAVRTQQAGFVDNDSNRPPVDERIKRELGHNLNVCY